MKAKLIKELHAVGIYRDPQTKQKLERMKLTDILQVRDFVKEEMKNGVVYERKQCKYEFVNPDLLKRVKAEVKKKKR